MNKFLLSTALMLVASGAMAADLPRRTMAPAPYVPVAPVFTWTGPYIGAQIGYGWAGDNDFFLNNRDRFDFGDFNGRFGGATSGAVEGVVGGLHAGYNWQTGSVVWGIEGDIEASGVEGDRAARGTFSFAGVPDLTITARESTSVNWMGSIRGRLGFAWWNQVLVYATGGLAFADIESDRNITFSRAIGGFSGTSFSNSVSDTVWGWTIGTGVEWAFAPNWTTRLEYRYTKFDDLENSLNQVFDDDVDVGRFEPEVHTVRVGVSYRF